VGVVEAKVADHRLGHGLLVVDLARHRPGGQRQGPGRFNRHAGEDHVADLAPPPRRIAIEVHRRAMDPVVARQQLRQAGRLVGPGLRPPVALHLLQGDDVCRRDRIGDALEIDPPVAAHAPLDIVSDDQHRSCLPQMAALDKLS